MKKNKTITTLLIYSFVVLNIIGVHGQFTFVHLTDLHVCDNTLLGNTGNYDMNGAMFSCCLKQFNSLNPKPAFLVVSGDISNVGELGTDGMYSALTQYLYPQGGLVNPANGAYFIDSAQTIPVYFVAGNHEYYQTIVPPLISDVPNHYIAHIGPDSDYSITYQNTVLLFLRTGGDRPIWLDTSPLQGEGKGISDDQCRWLRSTLLAAGNKRKIIVMHHPAINVNGTNIDGTPSTGSLAGLDDGSFLYNRETFLNICDSNHVDLTLCGHVHQNVVAIRAGTVVDENLPDGTRYIQTAKAFGGGYRILTVNSDFVNAGLPLVVDCAIASINTVSNNACKVYPNPFNSSATLELSSNAKFTSGKLIIFDLEGREVNFPINIDNNFTKIDRGDLMPGIYFYTVSDADGIFAKGKLMVKD